MIYRLVFGCIFIFTLQLQVDCLCCTCLAGDWVTGCCSVAEACSAAACSLHLQQGSVTCCRLETAADKKWAGSITAAAGDNDSGHCSAAVNTETRDQHAAGRRRHLRHQHQIMLPHHVLNPASSVVL